MHEVLHAYVELTINCDFFSNASILTCVLDAQKNHLIEMVLLSTNNISFGWEMRKLNFTFKPVSIGLVLITYAWSPSCISYVELTLNCDCFRTHPFFTSVLGAQKNSLIETALLSTNNICFGWEMRKLNFNDTPVSIGLVLITYAWSPSGKVHATSRTRNPNNFMLKILFI